MAYDGNLFSNGSILHNLVLKGLSDYVINVTISYSLPIALKHANLTSSL